VRDDAAWLADVLTDLEEDAPTLGRRSVDRYPLLPIDSPARSVSSDEGYLHEREAD
jgi:hypothetical protein